MPLPASGWLAVPQNQDPTPFLLPVAATGTYQEGGLAIATPGGAPTVTTLELGSVSASIETGDDIDFVDTLILSLERTDIFGVLLVDSFSAPDIPEPEVICFPDVTTVVDDPAGMVCTALATPDVVVTDCEAGPVGAVDEFDTPAVPALTVPADPTEMTLDEECIPHGTFGG